MLESKQRVHIRWNLWPTLWCCLYLLQTDMYVWVVYVCTNCGCMHAHVCLQVCEYVDWCVCVCIHVCKLYACEYMYVATPERRLQIPSAHINMVFGPFVFPRLIEAQEILLR